MLETVDHQILKIICDGHAKTASEFYYLETSAIPLKYLISSCRIMYLKEILSRNDGELIKRVYTADRDNPTKGDFIELVKEDLESIGEPFDENGIYSKYKSLFKQIIKRKIRDPAFRNLKDIKNSQSKIRDIVYDNFTIQPYITSFIFTNEMTSVLFNMRSSMTRTF